MFLGAVSAVAGAVATAASGPQEPATPPPDADARHPYPLQQAQHPTPAPAAAPGPAATGAAGSRPGLLAMLMGRVVGGAQGAQHMADPSRQTQATRGASLAQMAGNVEREIMFQRWFRVIAVTFAILLGQSMLTGAFAFVALMVGTGESDASSAVVSYRQTSGNAAAALFFDGSVAVCAGNGGACANQAGRSCGATKTILGLTVAYLVLKTACAVCSMVVVSFLCRRTPSLLDIGDDSSRVVESVIYGGWVPGAIAAVLGLVSFILSQRLHSLTDDPCGAVALLSSLAESPTAVRAVTGTVANLLRTVFVMDVVGAIVLLIALLFACLINENQRRQRQVCCCFC